MGSISNTTSSAMNVTIVGGGLVGLSAAVALRQAGHTVTIFEKSSFSHEVGAAVTMGPPVTRIMDSWGVDLKAAGATTYLRQQVRYAHNLADVIAPIEVDFEKLTGWPFYTIHRADVHSAIREVALDPDQPGPPITLRLSSAIKSYDSESASVTLADDTTHTADLLILADGLHSRAAEYINHKPCPIVPSNLTVVRFLIPTEAIISDPITAPVIPNPGQIDFFPAKDRYLVRYPCRDNTLQNLALYVTDPPETSTTAPDSTHEDKHNESVTSADLLAAMKAGGFCDALTGLVDKIPPTNSILPLWRCYDRPPLPRCTQGKSVMIGDASHPVLPHKGQGFALGAQDAAALGVLFSSPAANGESNVQERLKWFEELRTARTGCTQLFSSIDPQGNAGDMAPQCEKLIAELLRSGPGGLYGDVCETTEGGKQTVKKLPTTQNDVIQWIMKYDVVEDAKRMLTDKRDGTTS